MNKCCLKYGDAITEMMNEEIDKSMKSKNNYDFLKGIGNLLFEMTGNVNVKQRINIITG